MSDKNVIFMDFFAVKVDGSDVIAEISLYENLALQVPAMTSLSSTLTAKKSKKITFSSDKIYYNFSQENPKIKNI